MVVSFGIPVTCASFSRFIRFRESDIFDPKYIFWHLQYLYESGHLDQYHTQHTGVSRFQWSTFAENEVLTLPPLPTQKKIASILSAYDDLIENNLKRIKILEEMAQRLYREWFVHFRFPGHENVKMVDSPLGPIPEGWEVVELKDIACVNGLSLSAKDTPDIINYIDISSVSTGIINKIEPISYEAAPGRARRIVRHGDIIWSSVRPNRKSYALILFPENYIIASTGFAVLSPEKTPYTYLYCVVTTEDFTAYLTSNTTGAAYPAVNAKTFEKAQILLPDLATMQFFHDLTEPPLLLKQNYLNRNDILRQTRDFLLPKLISGEVDVEGLEIQDA